MEYSDSVADWSVLSEYEPVEKETVPQRKLPKMYDVYNVVTDRMSSEASIIAMITYTAYRYGMYIKDRDGIEKYRVTCASFKVDGVCYMALRVGILQVCDIWEDGYKWVVAKDIIKDTNDTMCRLGKSLVVKSRLFEALFQ